MRARLLATLMANFTYGVAIGDGEARPLAKFDILAIDQIMQWHRRQYLF